MNFVAEQWLLVSLLAAMVILLIYVETGKGGEALSHFEVTRLVNSGEAVLLDIREEKQFKQGHIVDALHIPHTKLRDRIAELNKYRDKTIVVLDHLGQHAGAAGKTLKDQGFRTCRLRGGMSDWQQQNLPLVK